MYSSVSKKIKQLKFAADIVDLLNIKVVYFSYREVTKGGMLREAIGTRKPAWVPYSKIKSHRGSRQKLKRGLVTYFDFTVQEWRSFYKNQVIDIHRTKQHP